MHVYVPGAFEKLASEGIPFMENPTGRSNIAAQDFSDATRLVPILTQKSQMSQLETIKVYSTDVISRSVNDTIQYFCKLYAFIEG